MRTILCRAAITAAVPLCLNAAPAGAQSPEVEALRQELQQIRSAYEQRITALEAQLQAVEARQRQAPAAPPTSTVAAPAARPPASPVSANAGKRVVRDNSFNPSIGVILNGKFSTFSAEDSEIAGFAIGEEGERGREGLAIDESELNFSANVDDKFYGSSTVAVVREDGEDKIELEEAYIQTLPGLPLPDGFRLKAGRAFWTLGYLNEIHAHADDFADRPLPYRTFLNKSYNDDGVEAAWVLPPPFFAEIGGGVFRGEDFPAGGSEDGVESWSAFGRVGGDFGLRHNWRIGGYVLDSDIVSREANEGAVTFAGDSRLYIADLRYTWALTGNPRQSELILQGEFFWRDEDGVYEDTDAGTGPIGFDDDASGWYVQSVYKFAPPWRVGVRYSRLDAPSVPAGLLGSALDPAGEDPEALAFMADWTNSEFERLRFQYNRETLAASKTDNQFVLQYVMSIGAHGAHPF
ncbi:MAG: hypothetical protein RIE22_09460 [Alphaproteobacteria bacterium]